MSVRGVNEPHWQRVARFWSKVDVQCPSKCWTWLAGVDLDGYGLFKIDRRTTRAARFCAELRYGEIPEGLWALHTCDNPICVNPHHIYLGTPSQNSHDRERRERGRKSNGSLNGANVLNEEQVLDIRAKHAAGLSNKEIAAMFGVCRPTISLIVRRKTWTHI